VSGSELKKKILLVFLDYLGPNVKFGTCPLVKIFVGFFP